VYPKQRNRDHTVFGSERVIVMNTEEFTLQTEDHVRLEGSLWSAASPKAVLFWIFGYMEHRGRYAHFATWMAAHDISVVVIDLRGHGHSEGQRGYVRKWSDYFYDVEAVMRWIKERLPGLPTIIGAHSNGGMITARFLESGNPPMELHAAILSSPYLGLAMELPAWKRILTPLLGRIAPRLSSPANMPTHLLTHDTSISDGYADDPLVFETANVSWFYQWDKNRSIVMSLADKITLPLLLMQGLDDRIASPEASREFFDRVGSSDKNWIGYEGFYHEILNELERERVYGDMLAWILKRL